jgi:N-ethylmaleimide reductase
MLDLFSPLKLGALALEHRVVLAPMTRIRADAASLAPGEDTATYYAQRASLGGLLITEAVHISPEGTPVWTIYPVVRALGSHVPGIWSATQVAGWQKVVAGVHAKGGLISCQLLHAGRVAQADIGRHPAAAGANVGPVSSSRVSIPVLNEDGNQYNWDQAQATPRALETDEIARVVGDYAHAATLAKAAGFDAVELHAAHGYLIDQFLCDGVNQRRDRYGGSVENRCRLLFEVVAALVAVFGAGRVGVRLSPTAGSEQSYFGCKSSDPAAVYAAAVEGLNRYPLAYLLLSEPRVGGLDKRAEAETAWAHPLRNADFRKLFAGPVIGAGGFTPVAARKAIVEQGYDAIAFGRWFLANPDLPERLRRGAPLNVYERASFYGGGGQGYVDYPFLGEVGRYRTMQQSEIGVSLLDSVSR